MPSVGTRIIECVEWFRGKAEDTTTISVRDLLAWVTYINSTVSRGLEVTPFLHSDLVLT